MKTASARKASIWVWLCVGVWVCGCGQNPGPLHPQPSALSPQPRPRPRPVAPLFDPSQAHSLLEDPKRDRWQQPDRIVRALRLKPGDAVADIGAGSGYLLSYLSKSVGPTGTVYAEEIQEEYLPDLERRAEALRNVRVVLGTAGDPKLPSRSVDCFVLLTVYHEVQQPVSFLHTLQAAARPGARLAIIDFDASRKGDPPAPAGHELPEGDVLVEARAAGWELAERHEFISSQFFLVFRQGKR
jgi:predicted methyltransferase